MGLDFVSVPFEIACWTAYLNIWHKNLCAVLLQVPLTGCRREGCSVSRALLHPSIEVPTKPSLPPGSPMSPLWREMLISRAFLYISFEVPVSQ
jgi:hypothetical protein